MKDLIILLGQVLNNMTGKQVAVLKRKFNEKEYTKQMYCLGMYYNEALIGIEANFSTYPIETLEDLKYPKQFVRIKEDDYRDQKEKKYGFKTTKSTRPLILGILQSVVVDEIENIQDLDTLNEMLRFIVTEEGRPEAEVGCHDDLVLALAIANYIRRQQKYTLLPEKKVSIPQDKLMLRKGKQNTYDYNYRGIIVDNPF